jgi:Domain of unknown function (DUF2019)
VKKSFGLKKLSVMELVERFAALGIGQFNAELHSDIAKQTRLLLQMRDVTEELKSRPGDKRSALLALFEHPNVQVRLMAAKLTLAIAPEAARQMLQDISDSKKYPQAMDAGMSLWNLDQGIFKPT